MSEPFDPVAFRTGLRRDMYRLEPAEQDGSPCPDHRPVLDETLGWHCPACGAEAPPDAGPPSAQC